MSKEGYARRERSIKNLLQDRAELLEACKKVLFMPKKFHIPCGLVVELSEAIAKAERSD